MKGQPSLFSEEPRYCMDTNVIVSFMRGTDDEHYGTDVFAPQWHYIEGLIASGAIVSPHQVELELEKWCKTIADLKDWMKKYRHMFLGVDSDAQLQSAKRIVNKYPIYGSTPNFLGDLEVITLADSLAITVISLEGENQNPSQRRPKIPNVCREFGIGYASLPGFLRRENFGQSSSI